MRRKQYIKHPYITRLMCAVIVLPLTLSFIPLSGCSQEKQITIGFVGGLSGRVSDLGGPARNGMLLAIEELNNEGGINGLPVKTLIKDDKQDVETAIKAVNELIENQVDAIIGPVTSAMAVKVAPIATKAKTLMMGVTVTTNQLTGIDDYFLRSLPPTTVHAGEVADYLYKQQGIRSFSAIYDLKNEAYTYSWLNDFQTHMEALGGTSKKILNFSSGSQETLVKLAYEVLEEEADIIVFITNSVDAALLAKLVRSISPKIVIATSEWAGTERLIELGGRYIEGAFVPQYLDRESQDADYLKFRDTFIKRFGHEPGFPGMISYNATRVVLQQLRDKPANQSLKEAILTHKTYPSIQGNIEFDEFGDAKSKSYVTQVKNGRFIVQPH